MGGVEFEENTGGVRMGKTVFEGFVTRDKDGEVNLWNKKPSVIDGCFDREDDGMFVQESVLNFFSDITWQNSPKKIKIIVEE